jgi:hypothetical protein
MKLGSLYDDPEARAEGITRQQLSLALFSPDWAIRAHVAATLAVTVVDTLEDQLYRRSFDGLGYQAQISDAHPVT